MDHKQVGHLWNGNADAWTKLARAGYDVCRDHFADAVLILPEMAGMKMDILPVYILHCDS